MNKKIWFAGGAALSIEIALIICSFAVSEESQIRSLNITLLCFGNALGWLLGTVVSPYDNSEKTAFSDYTKAASAFVSGYLLSKIDKTVAEALSPAALASAESQFRLLLFFSALAVALLITFISRKYYRG